MIDERILDAKQRKIKQWPVKSNRASEIGHECIKYLVLNRTRWQEKTIHDVRIQMIFDLGNLFESAVLSDLLDAGFNIVEQQRPFSWDKYNITGSIDCKILTDDKVYPTEIKSSAPYAFDSINAIDDMKRHKYHYMRKYPAQLTIYLLMAGYETGLFLFKNKSTGAMKEIWMDLDYSFAESLVQKAEIINNHVSMGTIPEPIEYDENICGDCAFAHICMPDRIGKEVEIVDDSELIELVARYNELKPTAKEYEEVDKRISKLVEGRDKVLAGDFFIQGKWVDKKNYPIPQEIKDQYVTTSQYWKKTIIPVGGNNR